MRRKIRLTESDINNIVRRTVKKYLNEGTTDNNVIDKWQYLLDTVGPEEMLDNIFNWSSSDQIQQWIDWFDEEDYFIDYNEEGY